MPILGYTFTLNTLITMANSTTGLTRIIKATGYSFKGLKSAFQHEAAFRQELLLVLLMSPFALWLGNSAAEKAVLLISLFIVLIAELLNSAIEAIVDRVGLEYHELSGRAKDIGSAAVFIALTQVAVIWSLIILPRFLP